ncbi:hypothetical protein BJ138DRAFT_1120947, partial [Hygrophoropsis aurantiaca]
MKAEVPIVRTAFLLRVPGGARSIALPNYPPTSGYIKQCRRLLSTLVDVVGALGTRSTSRTRTVLEECDRWLAYRADQGLLAGSTTASNLDGWRGQCERAEDERDDLPGERNHLRDDLRAVADEIARLRSEVTALGQRLPVQNAPTLEQRLAVPVNNPAVVQGGQGSSSSSSNSYGAQVTGTSSVSSAPPTARISASTAQPGPSTVPKTKPKPPAAKSKGKGKARATSPSPRQPITAEERAMLNLPEVSSPPPSPISKRQAKAQRRWVNHKEEFDYSDHSSDEDQMRWALSKMAENRARREAEEASQLQTAMAASRADYQQVVNNNGASGSNTHGGASGSNAQAGASGSSSHTASSREI